VKKHVQNIVEYLNSANGRVLFPNSLILALSSAAEFQGVRGPKVDDAELGEAGTITIRVPRDGQRRPAWVVDGQQRALALSRAKCRDFAIPVSAFIADDLDTQRDQFLRVNSTKPLPRGLISELLPQVSTILPSNLSVKKIPAAICEILNRDPKSPFHELIKRSSLSGPKKKKAIVSDTTIIQILQESFTTASGCLFAFRNIATGETDLERVQRIVYAYWQGVKDTFPDAWGLPPTSSRLMHSVGLRAMGRLMDRVMGSLNPDEKHLVQKVKKELAPLRSQCAWISGAWSELGGFKWNELQNVPPHLKLLTNHLMRLYLSGGKLRA